MIHGVVPGLMMIREQGVLVYSIFVSMLMANVAHLIIDRIGIRVWVQFVRIPKHVVLPTVGILCVIGVYIPSNAMYDIGFVFLFTVLGYLMRKGGFSTVCLVIGLLLGENFEISLRQARLMNSQELSMLFTSPIALLFLALTVYYTWYFSIRSDKNKPAAGASAVE
jgi:putative tricarboxylic transport membrane protein